MNTHSCLTSLFMATQPCSERCFGLKLRVMAGQQPHTDDYMKLLCGSITTNLLGAPFFFKIGLRLCDRNRPQFQSQRKHASVGIEKTHLPPRHEKGSKRAPVLLVSHRLLKYIQFICFKKHKLPSIPHSTWLLRIGVWHDPFF